MDILPNLTWEGSVYNGVPAMKLKHDLYHFCVIFFILGMQQKFTREGGMKINLKLLTSIYTIKIRRETTTVCAMTTLMQQPLWPGTLITLQLQIKFESMMVCPYQLPQTHIQTNKPCLNYGCKASPALLLFYTHPPPIFHRYGVMLIHITNTFITYHIVLGPISINIIIKNLVNYCFVCAVSLTHNTFRGKVL